jgi:uncharacterized membrane protein
MTILVLTFLHVATMFLAVAMSLGPAILIRFAGRTGNARSIQGVAETSVALSRFIGPVFVLGAAFGLATALVGGYDLTAPWLLIGYVLFVVGVIAGAVGEGGWAADVAKAAAANAEPQAGAALVAVLTSTRGQVAFLAFGGIVFLIILDMVIKPFS